MTLYINEAGKRSKDNSINKYLVGKNDIPELR